MTDDKQIVLTLTDEQHAAFTAVLKPHETPEHVLMDFVARLVKKRGGLWMGTGRWQTPDDNSYTRRDEK